jgi:hypothetical protein
MGESSPGSNMQTRHALIPVPTTQLQHPGLGLFDAQVSFKSFKLSATTAIHMLTTFLGQVATKVSDHNAPTSADDCWFYPVGATDNSGYLTKKLAGRGEANKHGVPQLVYFCCHRTQGLPAGLELAHICRRGRANPGDGVLWGCINPGGQLDYCQATNNSNAE